jgi:hypothetical protein
LNEITESAPATERAWAAGFFDGEGSVGFVKQGRNRKLLVSIAQVDRQALDRFRAAVVGRGTVYGPYQQKARGPRKPYFYYQTTNSFTGKEVIGILWDFLGPVKREQATRAFVAMDAYYAERPKSLRMTLAHITRQRRAVVA